MRRWIPVLACLLLGSGLTACSGSSDEPDVVAYFEDVGDLVKGATVQVADIEVGSVEGIELEVRDGQMLARVSMSIDDGVAVGREDLHAVVRQTSLLGEQFVELIASSPTPSLGGETVTIPVQDTARRVDVETFLADLSGFIGQGGLEDLNRFTHAQALILEDRGRRFGETLEELARFTEVLADRRLDIGLAIDHLASAGGTLAANRATLDSFLDSLDDANALLADQGDELGNLFRSLRRFGEVNVRFLARHEGAINRGFKALRPVLGGLAGAQRELRIDLAQLRAFFELFPKSMGGGPGDTGRGDYIQVDHVLCEDLFSCNTRGEKGDVPGEGS